MQRAGHHDVRVAERKGASRRRWSHWSAVITVVRWMSVSVADVGRSRIPVTGPRAKGGR